MANADMDAAPRLQEPHCTGPGWRLNTDARRVLSGVQDRRAGSPVREAGTGLPHLCPPAPTEREFGLRSAPRPRPHAGQNRIAAV